MYLDDNGESHGIFKNSTNRLVCEGDVGSPIYIVNENSNQAWCVSGVLLGKGLIPLIEAIKQ